MEEDIFYFAASLFIIVVLVSSVYLSFKGNRLAKQFLWSWALLLLVAAPFFSLLPNTITRNFAAIAVLGFVYALILLTSRNQQKLEKAHEETRRVLAESNSRMDEERRRIARQLHDDMNPKLVLSKLELQKLVPLINKGISDPAQASQAREIVERVAGFVGSVYQESRNIIKNTRVEIIDSIGLTAAIESLVGHYRGILEKPSITFEHNLPKRPDLPASTAVNAYRVIQEALLNVIKHAEASRVTISVQHNKSARQFEVAIIDDGVGLSVKNGHGIGLIDMRERARVLGAELLVESGSEKGAKVSFSFLDRDSSDQT